MAVSGPINASAVLYPEKDVGTHLVEGWVGPTAGIGSLENNQEKISYCCRNSRPGIVHFVVKSLYWLSYPGSLSYNVLLFYLHLKFFIVSKESVE